MIIELIKPEELKLTMDPLRTSIHGKEIYERITNGYAFRVDKDIFTIDRHGYTDLGSIPKILQVLPYFEHWRFPCAYSGHDSGYENKGFWINGTFTLLPRKDIDQIMKFTIIAEGIYQNQETAGKIVSPIIYSGVRAGGWYNWYNRKKIGNGVKS